MLRNYLKVAIRTLLKHKLFSTINLLGLSIGLAFAMVIGIFVLQQYSVNGSLKNVDRQYIIKSKWKQREMGLEITTIPALARALKEEYPNLVANYYRYNPVTNVVSAGDKHFMENMAIGDTSFISMYGFEVLHGDKSRAFTDNCSAVITETMAKKLFGTTNALNKTISVLGTQGGEQLFRVSAVVKDIPYNSVTHLLGDLYNVFLPTEGNRYYAGGDPSLDWNSAYEIGMVELQPGITPADLSAPVKQLVMKNASENMQRNLEVRFVAVKDYYLKDNNGAAYRMITILSIAAIFILLMAVINFVNIHIGAASGRLKEIGLRKVFGGRKKELRSQFILEALVLAFISAVIALVMYESLRSIFSDVLGTPLNSILHFGTGAFLLIGSIVVFTGLVAGIYPAWVLSASRVTNAVKGKMDNIGGGNRLRKVMLTVQYTLAIIVFVCALTVSGQVSYLFGKDLGYDKEQVMIMTVFPKQWDSVGVNRMLVIRDEIRKVPAVREASLSFEIPDREPPNSFGLSVSGSDRQVLVPSCGVDEKYASAFGLQMLAGKCFSQEGGFIPGQIVLNESAARALGLTATSAINKQVRISFPGADPSFGTICGVVKDFHYSTLHDKVGPLAFFHVRDAISYRYLSLKLGGGNIVETINKVRSKWKELSPNAPFEYTFMDEKFASLYRADLRLQKATSIATGLNLVIVFLGIFGVVSFTLAKRTKEIAVRRVLGARVMSLIMLFAKDYVWIMLIANLVAWPVAYMLTRRWLEDFAYRVPVEWTPYIIVAAAVAIGSILLIAAQSGRAAVTNPVNSLRNE
ncbi:MAG: ABC transporter permease [Chitinophagaceae bacterium]|nr:ABC transporter permease [Chitinophagaceae bacterium]